MIHPDIVNDVIRAFSKRKRCNYRIEDGPYVKQIKFTFEDQYINLKIPVYELPYLGEWLHMAEVTIDDRRKAAGEEAP